MKNVQQALTWIPYAVLGRIHPNVFVDRDISKEKSPSFLAKILPGGYTIEHTHSGTEIIDILQGMARISLDGIEKTYGKGECCTVCPGTRHRVVNDTNECCIVRATFDPPFCMQKTTFV